MKRINFLPVAMYVVLSLVVPTAFAQSKTIRMEPLTLSRGEVKFGPMTATAVVDCKSASASVTVSYAIEVQNQGRVIKPTDSKGDAKGPRLNLELLDKAGKLVARSERAIAPAWECKAVSKGSKETRFSLFNSVCGQIESFRLVPTSDTWHEEGC